MVLNSVVFPTPFGPRRQQISPEPIEKEIPFCTILSLYPQHTLFKSSFILFPPPSEKIKTYVHLK
jgi:hypothetical protein